MTIYLIRHGKTVATERSLYCGSTDLPLSDAGIDALKQLRYNIDIKNVRFITSGMKRTEQTLSVLFGAVPHVQEPRFREVDFGAFEMRSYEELKNTAAYQAWLNGDNEINVPPNGESGAQMQARVRGAFSEINTDSVVVTHGGVISAIMARLFPEEQKNRYEWTPAPGYGYVIQNYKYRSIP